MHNILIMPNTTPIETAKSGEISPDCESAGNRINYIIQNIIKVTPKGKRFPLKSKFQNENKVKLSCLVRDNSRCNEKSMKITCFDRKSKKKNSKSSNYCFPYMYCSSMR